MTMRKQATAPNLAGVVRVWAGVSMCQVEYGKDATKQDASGLRRCPDVAGGCWMSTQNSCSKWAWMGLCLVQLGQGWELRCLML